MGGGRKGCNLTIFITGFPGFIASRLVERLLDVHSPSHFYFLVEARFVFVAAQRARALEQAYPHFAGRWQIVEGDITRRHLGMSEEALQKVQETVTHCWHLAAVYDLAVPQTLAYRINVEGTQNVLELCAACRNLQRLAYVSTCYVAGNRTGVVYEDELDEGQSFKNHYESTKFWAEKQVRQWMDRIPTVILRPAIVVGDSRTGETHKGDGPYFFMQLLMRLPKQIPMIYVGDMKAPVNLVPVDWLVEAMVQLADSPDTTGFTFQLADPNPKTAREILDELIGMLGRAPVLGAVPLPLLRPLLRTRWVQSLARTPVQSIDYFNLPVRYDTSNVTRFIANTGRPCPALDAYFSKLVDYAAAHPEIFAHGLPHGLQGKAA